MCHQANDECAFGCIETRTGCPAGFEWVHGDECQQPPAPEPEPYDFDDQVAPLPGCSSADETVSTEPLFGKTGCDDDCLGGAWVEIQPSVAATAAVDGQEQEAFCTFCGPDGPITFETDVAMLATTYGFTSAAFCAPTAGQWP
jgi:hypothetical protein